MKATTSTSVSGILPRVKWADAHLLGARREGRGRPRLAGLRGETTRLSSPLAPRSERSERPRASLLEARMIFPGCGRG